jgi:rod shape-determining protein MreC
MAPPNHRRPGHSRKAQYSLFATYVLAIAGAVVAALLLLLSIADPKGFNALRTLAGEITAPAARFFDQVRRSVYGMEQNTEAYLDAASKNAALEKKLQAQRPKIVEAAAIRIENKRLRALLQLSDEDPQARIAIGRLISSTASSSRRIATLSIGSISGVEVGQPVRSPDGLIGRVLEVGPTTARILLISDADNVIPVLRTEDGMPALASGAGNGLVNIRPLDLGVNPFKRGDIIATSGNGGLYPPNVPYAVVLKKVDDGALAAPLASPGNSPYVLVMRPFEGEAKAMLDAPAPKPEVAAKK